MRTLNLRRRQASCNARAYYASLCRLDPHRTRPGRSRGEDAALGRSRRHEHHRPARTERKPHQQHQFARLRHADPARQGPEARAGARRVVAASESDHLALQAAAGGQVPRRHAVHRRRRRVQLRTRALRHFAAARVRQCLGHAEKDRRPHRRIHHHRTQSDRARARCNDLHHEQGMVRKESRDQAAELRAEGGHDHRAPGQRHRRIFAEIARTRHQDRAHQESQLVGHQGRIVHRQRRRSHLPADRLRRDAGGCACYPTRSTWSTIRRRRTCRG